MMYVNATNEMMKSGEALVGMKRRGSQLRRQNMMMVMVMGLAGAGLLAERCR